MKPHVLQLSPILIPSVNDRLNDLYQVHRYYEQTDTEAFLAEHGAHIRGVVSGGHTGIRNELMARLPALQVVAINGVGTDAVDLASARVTALCETASGRCTRSPAPSPWRAASAACAWGLWAWGGWAAPWPPAPPPLAARWPTPTCASCPMCHTISSPTCVSWRGAVMP